MFPMIAFAFTLIAAYFGFTVTRRFVRDRLKFVDGVKKSHIPWMVGTVVALVALPFAWFIPLVSGGAALALGVGVGTGIAAGNRDVRRSMPGVAMSYKGY